MIISILGSGSKGNCLFIGKENYAILIDAGLTLKQTKIRLKKKNLNFDLISDIFITHEHGDHVNGAYDIADELGIKNIWINRSSYLSLKEKKSCPRKIDISKTKFISEHKPLIIDNNNGITISYFPLLHDTSAHVGYSIYDMSSNKKIAIATDTGALDKTTKTFLKSHDLLILESNHDTDMLYTGPYPQHLIDRIDSNKGHMSNEYCAHFTKTLNPKITKHVVLTHISEENNSIEKMNNTFKEIVGSNGPMIHLSTQKEGSSVFYL